MEGFIRGPFKLCDDCDPAFGPQACLFCCVIAHSVAKLARSVAAFARRAEIAELTVTLHRSFYAAMRPAVPGGMGVFMDAANTHKRAVDRLAELAKDPQ